MADLCHEPHPDRPDLLCDKTVPCMGYHANGEEIWGIQDLPEIQTRAGKQSRLDDAATRTAPAVTTGAPVIEIPTADVVRTWEAEAGDWIGHAKKVLFEYCQTHHLFTTRDLWRLLPNPPGDDRRKMVVVTQYAVRRGWMRESGQYIRQTEPYVTSDGVRFPMNKAVPIFASRIWDNPGDVFT